jgi:hypothetical protein
MPASKHQLAASAYHLKPADVRKLLLAATNFRDRCLIKTLRWSLNLSQFVAGQSDQNT